MHLLNLGGRSRAGLMQPLPPPRGLSIIHEDTSVPAEASHWESETPACAGVHGCPGTAPVCLENPKQTLSKQYKAASCWLGLIIKVTARLLL